MMAGEEIAGYAQAATATPKGKADRRISQAKGPRPDSTLNDSTRGQPHVAKRTGR